MTLSRLRIAIVGAGPGGLTLGALLHRRGVPFTIYELRQKPTEEEFKQPAGSLDLHEGSGLSAIEELGVLEKFTTLTDDCSQMMRIADKNGSILHTDDSEDGVAGEQRPEISRNRLNQLLLSQLPTSSIQWRHKLLTASQSSSKQVQLDFGSNGKHEFDLVIGADGAWSRIRNLLTDVKPKYAGQQNMTTHIRQITTKYPHLARLVGSGTFMALGDRHGVVCQRAANDTARLYTLISTKDEDFATTHDLHNKTALQAMPTLFEGKSPPLGQFGPVLKEIISVSCHNETAAAPDATVEIRPLYTLYDTAERHSWKHNPGATLLGDAAHLMPPNGEGVNMAMRDSLELSKAIIQAYEIAQEKNMSIHDALGTCIKMYEEDMFDRALDVAKETEQLLGVMYGSDNGAQGMVKFFEGLVAGHEGQSKMVDG